MMQRGSGQFMVPRFEYETLCGGAVRETRSVLELAFINVEIVICQDRLGTNFGTVEEEGVFCRECTTGRRLQPSKCK
jgi:hypothetical protein